MQQACNKNLCSTAELRKAYEVVKLLFICCLCLSYPVLADRSSRTAGTTASKAATAKELRRCSIHVLDVGETFQSLPRCKVDDLVVSHLDQTYARNDKRFTGERVDPHFQTQYSHMYWIDKLIRQTGLVTEDIAKADVVLVNDHCYSNYWIAALHSDGNSDGVAFEPSGALANVYKEVASLPRFKRHGGRDFAFVFPHVWVHPGHQGPMCDVIHQSLHLTAEATHCYVCDSKHRPDFLVVPFPSPSFALDSVEEQMRTSFLFFLGTCAGTDEYDVSHGNEGLGKFMRSMAVDYLTRHMPPHLENKISCTERMPHKEVRAVMRRTKFCLLIAGDAVSTRRLSDIILSGCIPVFLGPPYHNTPLSDWLDYLSLGIFIHVSDFDTMDGAKEILREPKEGASAKDLFDVSWWIPSIANLENAAVRLALEDVVPYLLAIPTKEITAKQAAVHEAKILFEYNTDEMDMAQGKPSLGAVITDALCRRAQES